MTSAQTSQPLYRIGAVSKSTGIPVSTLRIWENRYGAFSPIKTEGNQRLFEENDVSKALLLKQLASSGHSIGAIARLDLDQLRRMGQLLSTAEHPQTRHHEPARMAIVGVGLANRIQSPVFAAGPLHQKFRITNVLPTLGDLQRATLPDQPQILLIKSPTLQSSTFNDILAVKDQHQFVQTLVIYNFAPDSVVQAMKFSGLIVRREPIADSELAELIQSVLFIDPAPAQEFGTTGAVLTRRKYSDETLQRVAGISTNVVCECPRHVAELISQLASFEAYSQECLNRHEDDAHLHAYLHSLAGSARSLFENALEKIAQHEGIDLTERQA